MHQTNNVALNPTETGITANPLTRPVSNPHLLELEPKVFWQYMTRLLEIPRASYQEQIATEWIVTDFAKRFGFAVEFDAYGNFTVSIPGIGSGIDAEEVIIQAHLDIVEKAKLGSSFDFKQDPIRTKIQDSEVYGKTVPCVVTEETTAGFDNGAGVCLALMAGTPGVLKNCPPLKLLFTRAEEAGLIGARELDKKLLTAKRLINLDHSRTDSVINGSAGSRDLISIVQLATEAIPAGHEMLQISLSGLDGGHSGLEIHSPRGNSVKSLLVLTEILVAEFPELRLAAAKIGGLRNEIPSDGTLLISIPPTLSKLLKHRIEDTGLLASICRGVKSSRPIALTVNSAREATPSLTGPALTSASLATLLAIVKELPTGVLDRAGGQMVVTSNNVANLQVESGIVSVLCMSRSSMHHVVAQLQTEWCKRLADLGADCTFANQGYIWKPRITELTKLVAKNVKKVYGFDPEIGPEHAGLEPARFEEKKPDLECVCFGINGPGLHSVDERLEIGSVPTCFEVLQLTLEALCEKKVAA